MCPLDAKGKDLDLLPVVNSQRISNSLSSHDPPRTDPVVLPPIGRSTATPLGSLVSDRDESDVASSRMQRAQETRQEMLAMGKERLRKRNVQREERKQVHLSQQSHQQLGLHRSAAQEALVGNAAAADLSLDARLAKAQANRRHAQQRHKLERESKHKQQHNVRASVAVAGLEPTFSLSVGGLR